MQVVPSGRRCQCGQVGCWEQYCSGGALARAAPERRPQGSVELSGQDVTAAASSGASWALEAFAEVGTWLGVGLAGLASALDPELIIIGGGLSDAGELLLAPARTAFAARLPGAEFRRPVPIVQAALGPDAGFIGAADLVRESVRRDELGPGRTT
jgi:glucokinase